MTMIEPREVVVDGHSPGFAGGTIPPDDLDIGAVALFWTVPSEPFPGKIRPFKVEPLFIGVEELRRDWHGRSRRVADEGDAAADQAAARPGCEGMCGGQTSMTSVRRTAMALSIIASVQRSNQSGSATST